MNCAFPTLSLPSGVTASERAQYDELNKWARTHNVVFGSTLSTPWSKVCSMFGFKVVSKRQQFRGVTYVRFPVARVSAPVGLALFESYDRCALLWAENSEVQAIMADKRVIGVNERLKLLEMSDKLKVMELALTHMKGELYAQQSKREHVVYDGTIDQYYIAKGDGKVSLNSGDVVLQQLLDERQRMKRVNSILRSQLERFYSRQHQTHRKRRRIDTER